MSKQIIWWNWRKKRIKKIKQWFLQKCNSPILIIDTTKIQVRKEREITLPVKHDTCKSTLVSRVDFLSHVRQQTSSQRSFNSVYLEAATQTDHTKNWSNETDNNCQFFAFSSNIIFVNNASGLDCLQCSCTFNSFLKLSNDFWKFLSSLRNFWPRAAPARQQIVLTQRPQQDLKDFVLILKDSIPCKNLLDTNSKHWFGQFVFMYVPMRFWLMILIFMYCSVMESQ